MKEFVNNPIYKQVISKGNIFSAIYSLESYVYEVGLLSKEDIKLYYQLSDKYNIELIDSVIFKCKREIERLFLKDELFKIDVFFKPKKLNDLKKVEYRPLHTADLYTQISIVSILNVIMFDDTSGQRKLSDISKLLPSNFYGNKPSADVGQLFEPWNKKYKQYTENSLIANNDYFESKTYRNEINLDLKKFYPSINPQYILEYILKKLPVSYNDDDIKFIKQLLIKLLYFRINNPKEVSQDYYPDNQREKILHDKLYFNIGLPQGLPQSYFFGNLCMIDISSEIQNKFDGDAFYYVDDSIIFTDYPNENSFYDVIKSLNIKINENISGVINRKSLLFDKEIVAFTELIKYKVKIHDEKNGKSTISEISKGDYLLDLNKPASTISFEIKASMDELEDDILRKKVKSIIELIQVKLKSQDLNEQNKKLLNRYNKFYKFRLKLLERREDNEISEPIINDFLENYGISDNNTEKFINKIEDDIFIFESRLMLTHLIVDLDAANNLINKIYNFEKNLSKNISHNNLYITKCLKAEIYKSDFKLEPYKSLEKSCDKHIEPFNNVKQDKKINSIEIIAEIISNKPSMLNEKFHSRVSHIYTKYNSGFYFFIFNNASGFKRKIVNSLLSKIINIRISDDTDIIRIDNRAIYYFELRLLMFIRTNQYDQNTYVKFLNDIISDYKKNHDHEKIDLALLEILPIFKRYVVDPDKIDELILAHKYVNGIWKNGSKFLHFYTLHNEEHSIELINKSVKITKAIDYLSIKKEDYYILFLACYFHDVSMVLYPNLDDFSSNNNGTNLIYTEWVDKLMVNMKKLNDSSETKKFIRYSYDIVNDYFESKIRDNHSKKSSKFIKEQHDLFFIKDETRQIVANVSEAHGYDSKDVYKLKSRAKQDLHDEKYLMIILRLADLLDMSKDRVSINVLRQNIKHMSKVSQYHWISHMAVDRSTLNTDFNIEPNDSKIKELVSINIQINTKQLTTINSEICQDWVCIIKDSIDSNNEKHQTLKIKKTENKTNRCERCNFTCKWMMNKHNYLFNELAVLENYLNRNPNNIFETKFEVNLSLYNTTLLPQEYMDIIKIEIE